MPRGVVIAGGGQGGFQAAASLRERGYAEPVTIVCEEPFAPYQRPPLSKAFLLGETDEGHLLLRPPAFYEQQSITLVIGERVTEIERAPQRVRLSGGATIDYSHLILATGARNRLLDVPGAELQGVHYLRTLSESRALRPQLQEATDVVIIGAGFIGLEIAAVASKLGKSVHVIDQMPRVMSRIVSTATSDFFLTTHGAWGSSLSMNSGVRELRGSHGRVREVVTSDGRLLPADVVVVGIGVVPNVELAAQAGLHTGNGILVDDLLSTADRAVSALGDCAFYSSRFCGPVRMESVQNAVDQARCIAARLTGSGDGYAAVPWFWSDQRDLKLQIVGMTSGCDRMVMKGDPDAKSFSVFCFKGEALAGIESVNRAADHMFGRRLFASGLQITAAEVADPEFDPREFLKRAAAAPG